MRCAPSEILGGDDRPAARAVLGTEDTATMVAALEGWLRDLGPVPEATAVQVGEWVALAEHDRSLPASMRSQSAWV